jgi:epoxyqueuosine reductase
MAKRDTNKDLFEKIKALSAELGFVACGCAKAEELVSEEEHYKSAEESGRFAGMDYLKRNMEKRFNPALLVPGAKSVLVFLAPFGRVSKPNKVENSNEQSSAPLISEFARGIDYHIVIKDKLYKILQLISQETTGVPNVLSEAAIPAVSGAFSTTTEIDCCKSNIKNVGRAFTDSAPVLERAWAVKAGLGFIGKNNFLISPEHGIKNFIGIIITTVVLPYYTDSCDSSTSDCYCSADGCNSGEEGEKSSPSKNKESKCGTCTKCIDACSTGALSGGHFFDARKCLSYKTIEERLQAKTENVPCKQKSKAERDKKTKWIFGCDDCMNACPWNSKNKDGWPEFRTNEKLLAKATCEWWKNLDEQGFKRLFGETPLMRAGLKKIRENILGRN